MKKSEFQQKTREIDAKLELEAYEKRRRTQIEMDMENHESNRNRARSITVGTAFGGTTEVMMRSDGGRHVWCVMQPVEVMELIHQLSANIGCHIHIKPRHDFGSWRDWKLTEEEKLHYNGHPPFVSDMALAHELGANMGAYEEAKRLEEEAKKLKEEARAKHSIEYKKDGNLLNKTFVKNNQLHILGGAGATPALWAAAEDLERKAEKLKEEQDGKDTMATKKTINKRTTKRTARAA
jgi:hypothetical protein